MALRIRAQSQHLLHRQLASSLLLSPSSFRLTPHSVLASHRTLSSGSNAKAAAVTAPDALESELAAKSGEEAIAPTDDPDGGLPPPPRKEAFLYYDSAFPIRVGKWDLRYLVAEFSVEDVLDRIKHSIPDEEAVKKEEKREGKEQEREAKMGLGMGLRSHPLESIRRRETTWDGKGPEDARVGVKDLVEKYGVKAESVKSRFKDGGAFLRLSYLPRSPTLPLTRPVPSPSSPSPSTTPHITGSELISTPQLPPNPTVTTAKEGVEPEQDAAAQLAIERGLQDLLNGRRLGVWYSWGQGRVFLVRGKPWLEDLDRYPSFIVRVNFEGPDIPQEELYEIFRPFGRMHDIVLAPVGDKERYATISFTSVRSAAAARNCLHGYQYKSTNGGALTTLRLVYKERVRAHAIRDWITSHPRLLIPLVASLIAGIGYTVFEPIRGWFVKNKVEGTWSLERYAIFSWLKQNTIERLGITHQKPAQAKETGIEKEREEAAEALEGWLRDMPDTFITVTGPRGSGKGGLLNEVLSSQKNVLTIDCEAVIKQGRNDAKLVSALAQQTGYFPQFSFLGSLNNMMDLAAVGVIGQKAGFSSTLDVQLKQVLDTTAVALKSISDSARSKRTEAQRARDSLRHSATEREHVLDLARKGQLRDGRLDCVAGNGAMSELGGGIEAGEADWVIMGPKSANLLKTYQRVAKAEDEPEEKSSDLNELPIVVVKSYYSKTSDARGDTLWNVLADWAAVLVDNEIAHVIFTSDNVTVSKPLAKALPNRPFNSVALTDASSQSALQFVQSKLTELGRSDAVTHDAEPHVAILGGRLTDLESLVQKISAGQTVDEAVEDIVVRSSTELRKNVFGDDAEEAKGLAWSRSQVWFLTKTLSKVPELKYADVLLNDPFKGDEKALFAIEQAEMISIIHHDGRPSLIRAGRPVFRSAFNRLTSDAVFSAMQDLAVNGKSQSGAEGDIKNAEGELLELAKLFDGGYWKFGGARRVPVEIGVRVDGLLGKIRDAEEKLVKLKEEEGKLKKVLKEER